MNGEIGEIYDVDLNCPQSKMWTSDMKRKEEEGGLENIGMVNEVRYKNENEDGSVFYEDSYAYKCSKPLKWRLEEGNSEFCGNDREGEDEGRYKLDCVRGAPQDYPDNVTDEEDDVPVIGDSLFCGTVTGARPLTSAFLNISSLIVKQLSDIRPVRRDMNEGETDLDISDDEGAGRCEVRTGEEDRANHKIKRVGRSILFSKCRKQFPTTCEK